MSKYKLIALDMDGTVLDEDQKISSENKKWIQKALDAGITVIFSTGRGIQSAMPYITELGLTTPIITVNGSEVWEAPGKLLKRHTMESRWITEMHKLAIEHDIWYWSYAIDGIHNKENWNSEELESTTWMKFGFYTENDEIRNRIQQTITGWDTIEITNSHPHNIECNPKGVNKAAGIQEVCKLLNIQMSEVVAIGDSMNDEAMIRSAGLGVAMGNAQAAIKAIADITTATNMENGVASVIREYVL